ncbi:MAG: HEAT repeat domain-containing protein, partial [Candidatus Latescibacteria bacterium]|nr:HEAT repeat domain-containing protein [Candidatus Latescibacterota bacterium]
MIPMCGPCWPRCAWNWAPQWTPLQTTAPAAISPRSPQSAREYWRALQAGAERWGMQILATAIVLLIFAGEALAQDPVGPGILALRDMLKDKNPQIRVKAAEGLGRVGGPESVATLRGSLSDKEISVRISAVEALGFIG